MPGFVAMAAKGLFNSSLERNMFIINNMQGIGISGPQRDQNRGNKLPLCGILKGQS
jgi:hypothetical protein